MDGKYPIFIGDALAGELNVSSKGAMTVFEAKCKMYEEIIRLSVYGEDLEGYLGVMVPDENNVLRLKKMLSPSAMRGFPKKIGYAARAGESIMPDKTQVKEFEEHETEEIEPKEPKTEESEPEEPKTEESEYEEPETEEYEPWVPEDIYWYSTPDGALVSFQDDHGLIAFAEGDQRIPPSKPYEKRIVEGKQYRVYKTKDGRIIS